MEDIRSKVKLDWEEIERLVDVLAFKIQNWSNFGTKIDSIYGCPRGGLIPAVMLSHKLGLPLKTYIAQIGPNTLIVDDICDSGETFRNIDGKYFAALHLRQGNDFPCIYAAEVVNDWIVYPWEDEKAEAIQDYLKK